MGSTPPSTALRPAKTQHDWAYTTQDWTFWLYQLKVAWNHFKPPEFERSDSGDDQRSLSPLYDIELKHGVMNAS